MSEIETTVVPSELMHEIRLDEQARLIALLEQTESPSHLWGGIAWSIATIMKESN